jgi:hypothetical protein
MLITLVLNNQLTFVSLSSNQLKLFIMSELSKGAKLAEDMGNFVNSYGHNEKDFIEGFMRQHRTLQQSSFRVILKLIEAITSDDYRHDGRNEASHLMAKKLKKGFEHQNFWKKRKGVQ